MSVIDSKKLLPPDKRTGAITSQKFLVPVKNLQIKPQAEVPSGNDLKPTEKDTNNSLLNTVLEVEKKVIIVEKLLESSSLLQKKQIERKRLVEEKKKFAEREARLEKKQTKGEKLVPDKINIPGQSIVDRIFRFLGFTLLGYLFNKYNEYLPKLLDLSEKLKPLFGFVESFATGVLNGVITFIDLGYKAYDQVRGIAKTIGGENALKTFDEFSSQLNTFINLAIIAGMSTMGGTDFGPGRGGPGGRRGPVGILGGQAGRSNAVTSDAARRYAARYGRQAAIRKFGEEGVRSLGGKYARSGLTNLARKGVVGALGKSGTKAAIRVLRPLAKGIPVLGGLLEFGFALMEGDNTGRAAFRAVGSTLFGAIGAALGGPFAIFTGGAGAWLGGVAAGKLYDYMFSGKKASSNKAQGAATGGSITRGGKVVGGPVTRGVKVKKPKKPKLPPQKTMPGKNVGGERIIEKLFTPDIPGQISSLRSLKDTSASLKKIDLLGNIMGASVDLTMGQLPDKNTYESVGNLFGNVIQQVVDREVSLSLNGIRSEIFKMADGGSVAGRGIPSRIDIAEQVSMLIQRSFQTAVESKAFGVLQNIRRQLNLEGGLDDVGPGPVGPGGATVSVSSDSPDFWLLAVASLLENSDPQGAADVAQVIYNRVSSPAWPSTIREAILQDNGGQFQPVRDYGTISAWRSIRDKQSAINFVKSYGGGRSQAQLESVAAALLNPTRQRSAATFVGPRDSFRMISFEDRYNHLADDTEQRRHGHVFGFEPGGAQIGSFRSGKLSPAQVSPQTKGTVTQLSLRGLPLTGENGRLKPSQLTRVGTLVGGVDYQDWYGSGAYLRKDAAAAFLAAKEQAKKEGITIPITSAYRSLEHQRALQGKYSVVAAPGTSRHGEGTALDIQTGTAGYAWFIENGPSYGWRYMAIPGDPVHFEYVGGFTPSTKQNQVKLSPIFNRASIAPTQPTSSVASLNGSGVLNEDTSTISFVEKIYMIQPVEKQIPVPA